MFPIQKFLPNPLYLPIHTALFSFINKRNKKHKQETQKKPTPLKENKKKTKKQKSRKEKKCQNEAISPQKYC